MNRTIRLVPWALALALAAGCASRQLKAGALDDVRKLAVVVRAQGQPRVDVARSDAREGRAFPTLSPSEADERLREVISRQVTLFELEGRVREALMAKLPSEPPWSTAMPAAEVATVLQSLLVVDRETPVDYAALASAGADAVLELRVTGWGVVNAGKTGLFLKGRGRLFRLPGGSTVWADSLDTDLAADPASEAVDVVALKNGGFREAVVQLVARLADRLAPQLAGRPAEP